MPKLDSLVQHLGLKVTMVKHGVIMGIYFKCPTNQHVKNQSSKQHFELSKHVKLLKCKGNKILKNINYSTLGYFILGYSTILSYSTYNYFKLLYPKLFLVFLSYSTLNYFRVFQLKLFYAFSPNTTFNIWTSINFLNEWFNFTYNQGCLKQKRTQSTTLYPSFYINKMNK